jgi:hypothetical protein
LYRTRYRVKNIIGWSDYSPISFILAAIPPNQPPMPIIVSASASNIQIAILPSNDPGGAPIDYYEIHRDNGDQGSYQIINGYDGLSSSIILDQVLDTGLVIGKVYRFKVRSHNVKGYSEFSPVASAAYADHPDKPAQPTKILSLSTKTSIAIEWALNTNHHLPGGAVTGYKVFVDDGLNGDFTEVFYGKNVPSLHELIAADLVQQRPYRFRIQAENFNGFGAMSDIITHWTCLPPSKLDPVEKVYSTSSSMMVRWQAPKDDGGCPILSYALFRDNGVTEIPSIEVNAANDPLVRNIPTIR